MRPGRFARTALHIAAAVIFIASAAMSLLPPVLAGQWPRLEQWSGFVLCVAFAAAIVLLAALPTTHNRSQQDMAAYGATLQRQLDQIDARLADLQSSVDRLLRALPTIQPPREQKDYSTQLQRLEAAIEQVRELSLLTDSQRQQRTQLLRQQRKNALLRELEELVSARQWARADRLLLAIETEFPADADVAKGRSHLEHMRKLAEEGAVERAIAEVEELMARQDWQQAMQRCHQLAEDFPGNVDAQQLLARVQREYEVHRQAEAQKLFDQIRSDVDNRAWRQALEHARQFLSKFDDHRLADAVRQQLPTLQDNAEIELRQEMEVRIQQMIRDGQFDGAIELAEELMRQYPLSPQAVSLQKLLPRLRELAAEASKGHQAGS